MRHHTSNKDLLTMDTWEKLFATTFFMPCPKHPQHAQRYYCCHTKSIFCELCKAERECHAPLKIYRNMYHDVVRVPHKKYVNIQTFMSNGYSVVYLRPHKSLENAAHHDYLCRCGRGVGKEGWFCSAQCYFDSAKNPKMRRRHTRKVSMPVPSPMY